MAKNEDNFKMALFGKGIKSLPAAIKISLKFIIVLNKLNNFRLQNFAFANDPRFKAWIVSGH
jgi:hypothetical protein